MEARFVGRTAELHELITRFEDALAGRGGVVLVAGEAGIGKTRLVAEFCRFAGTRAVPAHWGGCTDDEGAPAYWPWRRILRAWLAAADPQETARLTTTVRELARIAPEFGAGSTGPTGIAGAEQRFVLFDAAARFFTEVAAPGGLVLVIDDAHWADAASAALLAHLAAEAQHARLLVVVTYRPVDIAAGSGLAAVVAGLARAPGALRLQLAGLDEQAVTAALTDRLGAAPHPDVVATVVRRTRGNPFFVGELAGVLRIDPTAGTVGVPGAVRDVVRSRLTRLPPPCQALLEVAAVIGRDIDVTLLAAASGRPVDAVLDELAPAHDGGVLDRPPGRAGLRFGHDLVREAVLMELPPARRARIHQRIAEALQPAVDDPDVLPELAHHAMAALPLGNAATAIGWAVRAAEQAAAALAHEDAARMLAGAADAGRTALPVIERATLLITAARAHGAANDITAATALATEAVGLARRAAAPELVGRAALVLPDLSDRDWLSRSREWCEEALRGLGDVDAPLHVHLLAQLCHAMISMADHAGMAETSVRALAMAERLGDPAALASALHARQLARTGADGNAERLTLGTRMHALGVEADDANATMWGHLWRFDALLQAGRVADAETEVDRFTPVAIRMRTPLAKLHLLRSRAALAIGRGRFAEGTRLNDDALRIADDGGHDGAAFTAKVVRHGISALTGVDDGLSDWLETYAEPDSPWVALLRSSLAAWHLAHGHPDAAARWYAALPPPGSPRPPPFMVLALESQRALLAMDLGDADTAEAVHRALLPHAPLHAVGGAGAISTIGSVQLYLGVAAHAAGRLDAAVRHLREAIAVNDAAGLLPYAATARFRLAAALRARGRAADIDEAGGLLATAGSTAARLGMGPLQARTADLVATLRDGGALSRRETEIAELVAAGLTNRQAAVAAHISERTVESHVQHIMGKLGFTSRSQIAAWVAKRSP